MLICIGRPGVLGPVLGRLGPILYRASANVRLIHGAGGYVWLLHGAGGDVRHVRVACGDVRLVHMAGGAGDVRDRKSSLWFQSMMQLWSTNDQVTLPLESICIFFLLFMFILLVFAFLDCILYCILYRWYSWMRYTSLPSSTWIIWKVHPLIIILFVYQTICSFQAPRFVSDIK